MLRFLHCLWICILTISLAKGQGGNSCTAAFNNPVSINTPYINQSTCAKGNNFSLNNGQDWMYCFCSNQNACLTITITNLRSGDSLLPAIANFYVYDTCLLNNYLLVKNAFLPAATYNNSLTITLNVVPNKCYYLLAEVNDQGAAFADCINFNMSYDIAPLYTQTPGAFNCDSAFMFPMNLGTAYNQQSLCCVGNTYPATIGNDWFYKFCAPAKGCLTVFLDSIINLDNSFSTTLNLKLFDTCGGFPLVEKDFYLSDTINAAQTKFFVDSGQCYYLMISSDAFVSLGGCIQYNLNTQFDTILTQSSGAHTCTDAKYNPLIPGLWYEHHTTCCVGGDAFGTETWNYSFCPPKDGCAMVYLDSILFTNGPGLLHVTVTDSFGNPVVDFFDNQYPYGSNQGVDTVRFRFDVKLGTCYCVKIETYNFACIQYNLLFSYDTLANQLPGGNDTSTAVANPFILGNAYPNQSVCCFMDDQVYANGEDWLYYFTAPKDGCIRIGIDSFISGTSGLKAIAYLRALNIVTGETHAWQETSLLNQYTPGPELYFNVKAGDNYILFVDALIIDSTHDRCFNYAISSYYYDSIQAQTPGGNTFSVAQTNAIVLDSLYQGQTTCCMYNDIDSTGNGQDWIYYYCAAQTGCIDFVLSNLSSGHPLIGSDYFVHFYHNDTLVKTHGGHAYSSMIMADSFRVNVKAGECYKIVVDAMDGNNKRFNCINYNMKLKYGSINSQYPGGNTISTANTFPLKYDSVYTMQTTCCAFDDNNVLGQDWFYSFTAPQKGIYRLKINNVIKVTHNDSFKIHLTVYDQNLIKTYDTFSHKYINVDTLGILYSFCADSNEKFYFHVDDNYDVVDSCLGYNISIDQFAPVSSLLYPFGSSVSNQACAQPIVVNQQYDSICLCCLSAPYYFEFCVPADGCVTFTPKNLFSYGIPIDSSLVSAIYLVGPNCSNGTFISGGLDSATLSFHALAGECYKIVLSKTTESCLKLSILNKFIPDSVQTPGGKNCNSAQLLPVVSNTYYTNQKNCLSQCKINNQHTGNAVNCYSDNPLGNDYTYLIKPGNVGTAKVTLDGVTNPNTYGIDVVVAIYKNCNGNAFTNNVAYKKINVPPFANNILFSLEFAVQKPTDSFYLVVDALSDYCFKYNFIVLSNPVIISCNNADFEAGNTSGWNLSLGTSVQGCTNCSCPSPTYNACPNLVQSSLRHTIESSGNDYYGGFPKVYAGSHSLRLGDAYSGAQAEGIDLFFNVDAAHSNFTYNYAVVLQDPGHLGSNQPFFRAKVLDSNGNVIQCTEYCVSANSSVPGFQLSPNSGNINVYYKPWSQVNVDLSDYIGSTVRIQFENGDCSDGGHFGYSYIDCSCTPFTLNDSIFICNNTCDTLFAPPGFTNYTWYPGGNTGQYNVVCPNATSTYTLQYTNFSGCVVQKLYKVIIRDSFSLSHSMDCSNNGSATVISSVPPLGFNYTWSTLPVQTTASATNLVIGQTYTVSVSDGLCYTISDTILFNPPLPDLNISNQQNVNCFNASTGSLTLSGTNGIPPYQYQLNNSGYSPQNVFTNLSSGSYWVYVSDTLACKDSMQLNIVQNNLIAINFNASNACLPGQSAFVTALVSGGTAPYQYNWSSNPLNNTDTISLLPGTYSLTITDSNGCTASDSITIQGGINLQIVLVDSISCQGLSNGSLWAQVLNSNSSYTYSWNTLPIQTNDTASGLQSGIYIVTVTDTNGCTGTASYFLDSAESIQILDSLILPCSGQNNGSIVVNVIPNANYNYLWQNSSNADSILENIGAGIYTVTVSNAALCSASKTISVVAQASPNLTYLPLSTNYCAGTVALYTFSGADTIKFYQNSFSNQLFSNYILIDTSFNIILTGTNLNGCKDTLQIPITAQALSDTFISATICNNTNFYGYTTPGYYIDTFASQLTGCDSVRTIQLFVNTSSDTFLTAAICQGQNYYGYSSTGNYLDTFTNNVGCDSIRHISLTVTPSIIVSDTFTICQGDTLNGLTSSTTIIDSSISVVTGCDSVHLFNLIVHPVSYSVINQNICTGQSYLGYSTSGTYVDTLLNANGCDSIRTLNLTVQQYLTSTIYDSVCQGQSVFGYTTTGTYYDTFTTVGCDSIRTLVLTVFASSNAVIVDTICQGQNLFGYTTTGNYVDTLLNQYGCDSIRTLQLSVLPNSSSFYSDTICQGGSFMGYINSGTYTDTFVNQWGCDSIRTVQLLVRPVNSFTLSQSICAPNSFLGYSQSGTYIDTFLNQWGCDSIRTLILNVYNSSSATINASICKGQQYLGYTLSGTYIDTLVNINGCDSIRTLQLQVLDKSDTNLNVSICQGQTYSGYAASGLYIDTFATANGCDSIRTLNLTVHNNYFADTTINLCRDDSFYCAGAWQHQSGIYYDSLSSVYGCDSITKTSLYFSNDPYPFIIGDTSLCQGDSTTLYAGQYTQYLWNTGATSDRITVNSSGIYAVKVSNDNKCFMRDSVNVVVHDLPDVEILFKQDKICLNDTIHLSASGAENYSWYQFNTSMTVGYGEELNYTVFKNPSVIIVKGEDAFSCINYDSIKIFTIECCGNIFVANAFSPNNDNKNDVFKVQSTALKFEKFKLQIFNRYGEKVFESDNIEQGWDGTYNMQKCDVGTYFYVIQSKCYNSANKISKGDILLIR